MIIINAENQIAGRLAGFAAKKALLGETIAIINSEKAVLSGTKSDIFDEQKRRRNLGIPLGGPYVVRKPEILLKRMIRGMLPYKKQRGETALKSIMCYRGVPEKFADKETVAIPGADASKITKTKCFSLLEISKELGAKL